jgi:hypothetical protein
MNCFNHTSISAVAICQGCNKGLCDNCSRYFSIPICNTCNGKRVKTEKHRINTELIVTFIGGAIVSLIIFFIMKKNNIDFSNPGRLYNLFAAFYIGCGIISGWYGLKNKNYWLFNIPILGWILKMYACVIIGWVFFPIRTIKNLWRKAKLNKINNY